MIGDPRAVYFTRLYPIRWFLVSGLLIAEILFFALGAVYFYGFSLGVLTSFLVSYLSFKSYEGSLQEGPEVNFSEGGGYRWKFALPALGKYLVYGGVLALAASSPFFNFFATAGGLLLLRFVIQLKAIAESRH
ncbi:MAG: hypothetical protein ACLFN4_01490 [Candidatus Acetothermia bacterium]